MFERYTDRARRVVVLSHEQARLLNHSYIGTEHLLLALLHEGEGVAAQALKTLGLDDVDKLRDQIEEIIGQGQLAPSGHIPFTPRCKKVQELALREALQLGHNYIGTEHLLLGLIREGGGMGVVALAKLDVDPNDVRKQVLEILNAQGVPVVAEPAAQPDAMLRADTPQERRFAAEMAMKLGYPSADALLRVVTRPQFDEWLALKATSSVSRLAEAVSSAAGLQAGYEFGKQSLLSGGTPQIHFAQLGQAHASGHLSDALRALAPRVHDVTRTEHTVTEDKVTGEVVETLTVRWRRGDAS